MELHITLTLLIAVLSVIQSIFGVGLLVFGTPVLLFLGHSFYKTLAYLLPCSFVISAIQTQKDWQLTRGLRRNFLIYAVPVVIFGLILVLLLGRTYNAKPYVGAILLLTGCLRTSPWLRELLRKVLKHNEKPYLAVMGLIHGLTNMGGGLLVIMANSLFTQKEMIRANISFCYLVMAAAQLAVLIVSGQVKPEISWFLYPLLSAIVYWLVGQKIFKASNQLVYQHVMTIFILLLGMSLIVF